MTPLLCQNLSFPYENKREKFKKFLKDFVVRLFKMSSPCGPHINIQTQNPRIMKHSIES